MVFNTTFNNISAISWRSVLLVEETGVPGENHRPVASHLQTLSHNVVHLALVEFRTHNTSGDSHWLQGRIQDFKLGGADLKKIAPSGGRRENFGVFRVKNHDFTPKNHIFSNFRGGAPRVRPLDPPLNMLCQILSATQYFLGEILVLVLKKSPIKSISTT